MGASFCAMLEHATTVQQRPKTGDNITDSDSEVSAYQYTWKRQLHGPMTSRYWVIIWQSAPVASGDVESCAAGSHRLGSFEGVQRYIQIGEMYARFVVGEVMIVASLSHTWSMQTLMFET